jgi:uncharacterized protein (DUF3084 family)
MVSDDLVKRLLDWSEHDEGKINDARNEAAACIKALQAQLSERDKACAEWAEVSQRNYRRAKAAEAQLAKVEALVEAAEMMVKAYREESDQTIKAFYALQEALAAMKGGE